MKRRKINWMFFLNNKGLADGEGEGDPNPLEQALGDQLPQEEDTKPADTKPEDTKPVDTKPEDPKPDENLVDVDGYKGKDRRVVGFSGEEKRKDLIEKANNLDLDFDYGAGDQASKKVSIKEIKDTLKWLQDNSNTIAAGISMNKYSNQFPEFGKVIKAVIKGSFGDKNEFNSGFAAKILKAVEAKEDVIEDKVDEIDTEIAKIEKLLIDGEIDEDSPQADALKSSVLTMKATKTQLGTALSKLDDLTKKFDGYETTQKKVLDNTTKTEYKAEVTRIADLYSEELRSLTDKDKQDGYKFVVEHEAKEFDSLTRAGVRQAVADLKLKEGEQVTDEQFKKFITDSAKAAFDVIVKKREAIEQDYIKRKGGKPPEKKKEDVIPEAQEDMNIDDLTKTLEGMLPTKT